MSNLEFKPFSSDVVYNEFMSQQDKLCNIIKISYEYIANKNIRKCVYLFELIEEGINKGLLQKEFIYIEMYKKIQLELEKVIVELNDPFSSLMLLKECKSSLNFPDKHIEIASKKYNCKDL